MATETCLTNQGRSPHAHPLQQGTRPKDPLYPLGPWPHPHGPPWFVSSSSRSRSSKRPLPPAARLRSCCLTTARDHGAAGPLWSAHPSLSHLCSKHGVSFLVSGPLDPAISSVCSALPSPLPALQSVLCTACPSPPICALCLVGFHPPLKAWLMLTSSKMSLLCSKRQVFGGYPLPGSTERKLPSFHQGEQSRKRKPSLGKTTQVPVRACSTALATGSLLFLWLSTTGCVGWSLGDRDALQTHVFEMWTHTG